LLFQQLIRICHKKPHPDRLGQSARPGCTLLDSYVWPLHIAAKFKLRQCPRANALVQPLDREEPLVGCRLTDAPANS
jgi:hypothetical protein